MKKPIFIVSFFVLAMTAEVATAEFSFGTPTNLGPIVNSPSLDGAPSVTADGLSLFFNSKRSEGYGDYDIWLSIRQTTDEPWGEPVNLGPNINTSSMDGNPVISRDGLTLYFTSNRPGGYDSWDIYVTTRTSMADSWSTPTNLGAPFNSSASDSGISVTADGLTAFFGTNKPGGFGNDDIYMSSRTTPDDPWGEPMNLGSLVNSPSVDGCPMVSTDGLSLYFHSNRPGGYGGFDAWVTTRPTINDEWGEPMNLGPIINTSDFDGAATISADSSTLYFMSGRPGGSDLHDLWQAPVIPIIDLNGDGTVNCVDMCKLVNHWHTNHPPCDVAPVPFGDGFVDVRDMTVLAEHLFENVYDPTLVAHWALDEAEGMTAQDSVTGRGDWIIGNPLWQPTGGKVGGALQLDGVDDCVIPTFGINPAEGPFSVLA